MFPNAAQEIQQNTERQTTQMRSFMNSRYSEILDRLLSNLEDVISQDMANILRNQLDSLKILPPILPEDIIHQLPTDQYYVMSTLRCYLGRRDARKWPYFFVTGSAGTGKSYIIHLLINLLRNTGSKFLLMAPTGIAAQNIGGTTIHSNLRITSTQSGFHSLAFHDNEFKQKLKEIETIIIEEVSMVSSQLFDFISDMFSAIHDNNLAFGGINVVVVGDLAQLPPVTGSQVFKSSIWKLFYPLFLRQPHRQQDQSEFYEMLQNIRLGNLTDEIWEKLQRKHDEFNPDRPIDILLNTTNIVGYRETANRINHLICNSLPVSENKFMISNAIDTINREQWSSNVTEKSFKL
jgi:Cdc6-like AAA superfamily ATPase